MGNLVLIVIGIIVLFNSVILFLLIKKIPSLLEMILSNTGMGLGQEFQLDFNLQADTNNLLCVDVECNQCKKIIQKVYSSSSSYEGTQLIFLSQKETVELYFKENNLDLFKVRHSYSNAEDLYLTVKPFLYVVSKNGKVQDKHAILNIAQLDDYLKYEVS